MLWISQNYLALYGAVTGTIAILISFFNYRYNVNKDQIKLVISCKEHPMKTENIELLINSSTNNSWDRSDVAEVYLITVRNFSNIPVPLDDVGVIDEHKNKHHISPKTDIETLKPKSSKTFSVYLWRDEALFMAKSAYVIDQTGKEWKGHLTHKG